MQNNNQCEKCTNIINELKEKLQIYIDKEAREKEQKREYRKANIEHIKKKKVEYEKNNPEKKKLYQKRWREKEKTKTKNNA